MTQVCRPTPFGQGASRHPRDLAASATSVSNGTACELGNSITPGPVPENLPKCFSVENVQENWNHFLSCETWKRLFCEAPQCGLHPQV